MNRDRAGCVKTRKTNLSRWVLFEKRLLIGACYSTGTIVLPKKNVGGGQKEAEKNPTFSYMGFFVDNFR